MRLVNQTRGVIIATRVDLATSLWARTRGVIGRSTLPPGYALVIRPCRAIHTCLVAQTLDVAHVDRDNRIVRILPEIKPWRVGLLVWKSTWVIELPAGTVEMTGTQIGDEVEIVEEKVTSSTGDGLIGRWS